MKKVILLILALTFTVMSCAQSKKEAEQTIYNPNAIYQLVPTQNFWTFLKLDTRNGKVNQVHFTVGDGERGELTLNGTSLVQNEEAKAGRFKLYPTNNIYNFILLDQISGDVWQVQWSFSASSRDIVKIPSYAF